MFDTRLYGLRQQLRRRDGKPNLSIADFVAPASAAVSDHIGAFAVTAGPEEIAIAERFEAANDDYSSILVKALADRIAEALAEYIHARVRREIWGYAPDEPFSPQEMIGEPYRGIRPAPGYPSQPDHSEKVTIFDLLDAERRIGLGLTESFAMWPGSSVSGLYFAHPDAKYFAVGRVQRDQVESYAERKNITLERAEQLLGSTLAYQPTWAIPIIATRRGVSDAGSIARERSTAALPVRSDVLGFAELVDAFGAAFAAEARLLHPAERGRRIGDRAAVEADHAGLDLLADRSPFARSRV